MCMYTYIYIHIWFIHVNMHIYMSYKRKAWFLLNKKTGSVALVDQASGRGTAEHCKEGLNWVCIYVHVYIYINTYYIVDIVGV